MKTFTKVTLVITTIMATIGITCILIACMMGFTWGNFRDMVMDGRFTFHFGKHFNWEFVGVPSDVKSKEITEDVDKLEVEYGAGELEICYGDVEYILVEQQGVVAFDVEVEDGVLSVEGGLGFTTGNQAMLKITIPSGMEFEQVDLEIGASSAEIKNLKTDVLKIEVGAGTATLTGLDVKELESETGVGELTIEMVGKKSDYSYSVDCGIGSVKIGDDSYEGIGTSKNVENSGADRYMDIECGVGEVEIHFEK